MHPVVNNFKYPFKFKLNIFLSLTRRSETVSDCKEVVGLTLSWGNDIFISKISSHS